MKCPNCEEQAIEQKSYVKMNSGKTYTVWVCPNGHQTYKEYDF